MKAELREKIRQGRPVRISDEEAAFMRDTLRRAMAVTLEKEPEEIGDGALVFDDLGLDSIDVFDLLDQLAEELDMQVEPEQLPDDVIYGREGLTFHDFAEVFISYFRSAPPE